MARIGLFTDREMLAVGLRHTVLPNHALEVGSLDRVGTEPIPPGSADLLILDAPPEASHLIGALRSPEETVPVVVWERVSASEPALNALGSGVQGVLMDNSSAADIHACVDAVLHGGIWVPPCIAQAVVSSRRCRLTRREAQLVSLVSQGMSNKDIAFSLGISVGTVKVYLSRLFDKLEVSDRYELALVGLRQAGSAHAGAFRDAAQGTAGIGSQSVFVPRSNERWHHEASVS